MEKDNLLEFADLIGQICERPLTVFEFRSLVTISNKYSNETIKNAINQFPERYIEHPVAYLKAILENVHSKKSENTKKIIENIGNELSL